MAPKALSACPLCRVAFSALDFPNKTEHTYKKAMVAYEKILVKQPDMWIGANDLIFLKERRALQWKGRIG